jgi:hypothetical protein
LGPLLFSYSNVVIPGKYRATFNSIQGAAFNLGAALSLLVIGCLSLAISPLAIWALSATALTLFALFAWRRNPH